MPKPAKPTAEHRSAPPPGRAPWWLPVLLLVLVAALYSPVVYHEFVNYDDPDYVSANPRVLSGLSRSNLQWALTSGHASNWHPLTWISHQLDSELFGSAPGGPHLVNTLLHTANVALLFVLLRRLTGSYWRSLIVCGIFALHPLRVESVAWISERKDVLSGFFFLLTLLAYREAVSSGVPGGGASRGRRKRWFAGALACYALGLLSKPMLVTLPFVLLLLDVWPLGRIRLRTWLPVADRAVWWEKVPFLLLAAGSCVITYLVQREGGAVSVSLPLSARLANAAVAHLRYLGKFLWPVDLAVLYPHPGYWPVWLVTLSVAALLVLAAGACLALRRAPFIFVGYAWFLGMLVPVIGIVQVGVQSLADRYTYLPMIGLSLALVWGAAGWLRRAKVPAPALAFALLAVFALWAYLTGRQVSFWHDSETLFTRATRVTRNNYLAYNNLGFYLGNRGKTAEAMENYRNSLAINPNYEDALNNLGHALAEAGHYAEAIPLYRAALAVRPNHVEVHNNLGNALSETGQVDEAIRHYEFVLGRNPRHPSANNNYGIALAMKGRLNEAMDHFRTALREKPDYAGAYSNLGNAYAAARQFDQAEGAFKKAMELSPRDPQARNNYANVLCERNLLPEAIVQYQIALRLRPVNPETHLNLAVALLRAGQKTTARNHLEAALRQRPGYLEAARLLKTL